MPQTTSVLVPPNLAMRDAARFVHWLRGDARFDWNAVRLREAWDRTGADDAGLRFERIVNRISGYDVYWCDECDLPAWHDAWAGYLEGVEINVCYDCRQSFYYCESCEEWDRDPHEHQRGQCEAPHQSFRFPIKDLKAGFIEADTRFTIEIAGGTISREGLREVANILYRDGGEFGPRAYNELMYGDFDPQWTNKHGNFPKRIAKLYLQAGYKLSAELMTRIGNTARAHTSTTATRNVEFTRDLCQPASEFLHGGSCWWGSESQSMCILKGCGGLAIRTFATGGESVSTCADPNCTVCQRRRSAGEVNGRAWIVPMIWRREFNAFDLTHDCERADGFVVFNVYGPDGYDMARMVAQFTGKSYRKVVFRLGDAYINNSHGFLIASADVCERTSDVRFDIHAVCDCA